MKTLEKNITKSFKIKTSILILLFTVAFANIALSQSDPDLERGYQLLNEGNNSEAAIVFEEYVTRNPGEIKIILQLAYIHKNLGNNGVAKKYFEYVVNNSPNTDDIAAARTELDMMNSTGSNPTISRLDEAYNLFNAGKVNEAAVIFEEQVRNNPSDTKTMLQLGYIYKSKGDYTKALEYFNKVYGASLKSDELKIATTEIADINTILNPKTQTTITGTTPVYSSSIGNDNLNKAYTLLNQGFKDAAIPYFEQYLISNPNDTKVQMQLAYLYYDVQQYTRAKERFQYVANNSASMEEKNQANSSITTINNMRSGSGIPQTVDIYFYNIYDTYQKNYISNFLGKYGFGVAKNLNMGIYVDAFLDSRSTAQNILNDRYVEAGGYVRYSITSYMSFEVRAGYVRQIDREKNSFNFKPILSFGNTFGSAPTFLNPGITKKEYLYLQFYGAILYDYKFRNMFGQGYLKEGLRFMMGGYSNFEFYLRQQGNVDSQNLPYNNYIEFAGGVGFQPNIKYFPTLFAEATNKIYFSQESQNTFQFRVGFLLGYFSQF
ncbi:MAG TPA: tetratricopeptide repeat protein [Ignavibacteria bacterium]|nr:tetratricopeptide repeat protein [Ignavibacteria bacterium]